MGTVTTYNEKTGRYEVRSHGQIVGAGSSPIEAQRNTQAVQFQREQLAKSGQEPEPTVAVKTESGQEYYIPLSMALTGEYGGEKIVGGGRYYDPATGTLTNVDMGKGVVEVSKDAGRSTARQPSDLQRGMAGIADLTPGQKTLTPHEAYIAGIISKNELQSAQGKDVIYNIEAGQLKSWVEYRQLHPDVERMYVPETHSLASMVAWKASTEMINQQETAAKMAELVQNPVVQASYVFRGATFFGIVPAMELGVASLTKQDPMAKFGQLTYQYVQEIWSPRTPIEAAQRESLAAGFTMAALVATGGAFGIGAKVVSSMGLGGLYAWTLGTQYGETIKEPTGENIARSFVYSAPLMVGGVAKLPHPMYGKVELPIAEGVKENVWRGIYIKYGTGSRVIPLGKAEIDLTIIEPTKGWTPVSAIDTKVAMRSLESTGFSRLEIEAFKADVRLGEIFERQKSAFKAETFSRELRTQSPAQFEVVLDRIRMEDALFYGSKTMEAQMRPGKLGRIPGDVDMQLNVSQDIAILKTKELFGDFRSVEGKPSRISPMTETLIETKDVGEWHHAVDIHSLTKTPQDALTPTFEGGLGFKFGQRPVKIEDTWSMQLSESFLRKSTSTFTFRPGGFSPELHRMKDVSDMVSTGGELLESLKVGKVSRFKIGAIKEAEMNLAKLAEFERVKLSRNEMEFRDVSSSMKRPAIESSMSFAAGSMAYASKSVELSMSPSMPSISESMSLPPSPSPSASASASMSMASASLSLSSMSASLSLSPSISPSLSPSMSPSVSMSMASMSPSVSPSISPSSSFSLPSLPFMPSLPALAGIRRKRPMEFKVNVRDYAYVPSFWGMLMELPKLDARKIFSGLEIRGI